MRLTTTIFSKPSISVTRARWISAIPPVARWVSSSYLPRRSGGRVDDDSPKPEGGMGSPGNSRSYVRPDIGSNGKLPPRGAPNVVQPGAQEFSGTERFQLLSRIGEGGMGVVYKALDRELKT